MIKRTIEISREPSALMIEHDQLLIVGPGQTRRTIPHRNRIPCEDIGVLIVDERDTTYTHSALTRLVEHGAAVVVCGRDHLPAGILLPVSSHSEQLWRLDAQLAMKRPLGKRLWAQIITAKIREQSANIEFVPDACGKLTAIAQSVRSGDAGGAEAHAARIYWSALFQGLTLPGGRFRRRPGDPKAPPPNNLLDYGYAVMRAAVARALVGAGLFPALGLKHAHRANAFALADDLVEPLRPIVDCRVRRLCAEGRFALDRPTKAELLVLLSAPVKTGDLIGPLQVALPRYTASLLRCLEGQADALDIPRATGPAPRGRDLAGGLEDAP